MKPHIMRTAASGPLDGAMEKLYEIQDYEHLLSFLKDYWSWEEFSEADLYQKKHGTYDRRIGWSTWLLCINGKAAFFMKGKFPDPRLTVKPDTDF